jgi:hypothetical protein
MENISKPKPFTERDRAYRRQRYKNRMFGEIAKLFAEEAERNQITKRDLADWLDRDPAQITRWLSAPSNLTLETISDMLLALGAEEDPTVRRFLEKSIANYMHPLIERAVNAGRESTEGGVSSAQLRIVKSPDSPDDATTVPRPSPFEVKMTATG